MDEVARSKFTATEKENFNRVRLWIGVHSLAEITTANGHKIMEEAWRGHRQQYTATLWPIQLKPGQ